MKALPRPVKQVLAEPNLDASVARVWARVQRRRRVPRPLVRPPFVLAAMVAAISFVVFFSVTAARRQLPVSAPAMAVKVPVSSSAVACETTPPTRAVSAPVTSVSVPLVHARRPNAPPTSVRNVNGQAVDVVGALLQTADDAARDGHLDQVVAVLEEIASHHADDPRAAEALYTLGCLQLDVLKRPGLAAASLRRALELQPSADLVAPIWERLNEATAASAR